LIGARFMPVMHGLEPTLKGSQMEAGVLPKTVLS
jgi:hypothetical protein